MEENNTPTNTNNSVPDNTNVPLVSRQDEKSISHRDLVEKTFIELGFTDENPEDLDAVTELLDIFMDNQDDRDIVYTPEQYILLNDPDVQQVIKRCQAYYEPKRHLTKGDLRTILEDIARGKAKRWDYDFKNGSPVEIEPTFSERITAIKMLQEGADDENKTATVQFINNIINPNLTQQNFHPNIEAPQAPPEGHYSLNLNEEIIDNEEDI